MTLDRLIAALVQSKNGAADDALLEAVRRGALPERAMSMEGLLRRKTSAGLVGLIGQFDDLPTVLQDRLVAQVNVLYHALREAGRSDEPSVRTAAMRLIAVGHQGKLAYVLSENLRHPDPGVANAAAESLTSLATWVANETRTLQRSASEIADDADPDAPPIVDPQSEIYRQVQDQRPDIEQAVARAMDGNRGQHAGDLLRAALLMCDSPASKVLAIVRTTRHAGQAAMVRRLQQPPAAEHVEAFLLAASHGGLRSHFGVAFARIEEAPVLDALLRRTHWLKDGSIAACLHLVTRGTWWTDAELVRDVTRRDGGDAARVGEWVAASGVADVVQDERLDRLRQHLLASDAPNVEARLRLLRIAARRPRGASVQLIESFLNDPDERLARMAVREVMRRQPADFANRLLPRLGSAPESVRRVIARAVGETGFDHFWTNFDRLDKAKRRQAGRALFKLLPDATARLVRRLSGGSVEQRLKAMQVAQDLSLGESVAPALLALCRDASPRVRSKAVQLLAEVPTVAPDALVEKLLSDADPRVRANAIEVLETHHRAAFLPLLVQRARGGSNRERANAIKVIHRLRLHEVATTLSTMLADPRPEHRISALWTLREIGLWNLVARVGQMVKADPDPRVRKYALGVLQAAATIIRDQQRKAG